MSTTTSKQLTTDDRRQYVRKMAVAITFALLFVLVLGTSWFTSTYGGSEMKTVAVCGKHQMGDSGQTRVTTSDGTYRIDTVNAAKLKRGNVYTITTTGWTFGNFSLMRTITAASLRSDTPIANCD